jgi:AcrR family transcriptional regulator
VEQPVENESGVVVPQQARGRDTHTRLVQACLDLIEEKPFVQITIAEIAAEAGVSVGNFYRRFRSKESILPDLYAAYEARFAEFAGGLPDHEWGDPDDLRGRMRVLVSAVRDFITRNRGLVHSLHLHARLHPEIVPAQSVSARENLYVRVGSLLGAEEDPVAQLRGRVIMLTLISTLTEQILYPEQSPAVAVGLETDALTDELARMFAAYGGGEW